MFCSFASSLLDGKYLLVIEVKWNAVLLMLFFCASRLKVFVSCKEVKWLVCYLFDDDQSAEVYCKYCGGSRRDRQ
jgi:hypothetical protein